MSSVGMDFGGLLGTQAWGPVSGSVSGSRPLDLTKETLRMEAEAASNRNVEAMAMEEDSSDSMVTYDGSDSELAAVAAAASVNVNVNGVDCLGALGARPLSRRMLEIPEFDLIEVARGIVSPAGEIVNYVDVGDEGRNYVAPPLVRVGEIMRVEGHHRHGRANLRFLQLETVQDYTFKTPPASRANSPINFQRVVNNDSVDSGVINMDDGNDGWPAAYLNSDNNDWDITEDNDSGGSEDATTVDNGYGVQNAKRYKHVFTKPLPPPQSQLKKKGFVRKLDFGDDHLTKRIKVNHNE